MLNMLMFVIAIQFALILFNGGIAKMSNENLIDCTNPAIDCTEVDTAEQGSVLTSLIFNPSLWDNGILLILFGNLATVGGLILGTFWIKNDFVVMAVIVGSIFSFGFPIFTLWQKIRDEMKGFIMASEGIVDVPTGSPEIDLAVKVAGVLTSMILFPFIIGYIWTVLDWWRGRD